MRAPIKARGERACKLDGRDYILCPTMQALDCIETESKLSIQELLHGLQIVRLSVVRTCFEALVVEGDASAAFEDKVGIDGVAELSAELILCLFRIDDPAQDGDQEEAQEREGNAVARSKSASG